MADSLASQIITAIGGPKNVRSLTHCAPRLRFELADASKVDQNALEHMKGVLGAVPQSGDRFQVVIGGGVAKAKTLLFQPLQEIMKTQLAAPLVEHLEILPAQFGTEAGILGSAHLALNTHFGETFRA